MINRILIRIKVIQILYSFLVVEKQLSLVELPDSPTKEKRFGVVFIFTTLAAIAAGNDLYIRHDGGRRRARILF